MGFHKFLDDGTFKFNDDRVFQTHKFVDDPVATLWEGTGGFTIQENVFTLAENVVFDPGEIYTNPAVAVGLSAQPFVLANPHHSMDWTKTFGDPNDPAVRGKMQEVQMKQLEVLKAQLSQQLKQLESQMERMNSEMETSKSNNEQTGQNRS